MCSSSTTTRVSTPQSRCRAAMAQGEITPPVGIYHRMWGAALHDRATGVHRPLMAVVLWMQPEQADAGQGVVLVTLDHCILERADLTAIREAVARGTGLTAQQVLVSLTHTHGSGLMTRSRSHLPGGDLIGPYLDSLPARIAALAAEAQERLTTATIVYGQGRCALAAHRDFPDPATGAIVCGYNPDGPADDTLLVARIQSDAGAVVGTVVNYACHPTTLAWENTLISPDWVGALREEVERATGSPCLFLQGASADLGPRVGFVGDVAWADRNGLQVAHATLATVHALPPDGTEFVYQGPVVSGAILGTWRHEPVSDETRTAQARWTWRQVTLDVAYRADLPTLAQTRLEREQWQAEEDQARAAGDEARLRDCRAKVEQRTRQIMRLEALAPGTSYPLEIHLAALGEALWVFTPGELYQMFQQTLRARFPERAVLVTTLTNDWQPGYIPPQNAYGKGIYQEIIAATAPGELERLTQRVGDLLATL